MCVAFSGPCSRDQTCSEISLQKLYSSFPMFSWKRQILLQRLISFLQERKEGGRVESCNAHGLPGILLGTHSSARHRLPFASLSLCSDPRDGLGKAHVSPAASRMHPALAHHFPIVSRSQLLGLPLPSLGIFILDSL